MGVEINTWVLLFIGGINLVIALLAIRTHSAVVSTKEDVKTIEIATNSMKDALVKATGEASRAAGKEEGLAIAAAATALKAEGGLDQSRKPKL